MKHYISSLCVLLAILFGVSGTVVGQGTETFNHSSTSSGYGTISWIGSNGVAWSALDSRGDQVITAGNKAICIRQTGGKLTGNLTVAQQATGIGKISFTAKNTASTADNTKSTTYQFKCGSITKEITVSPMGPNAVFVESPEINSTDATLIEITITAASGVRITIDDLSWTAAANSSTPSLTPISPVDFGSQNVNTSASKNINVKGANLTGDLTVAVSGEGFSGSTTVTKADAEAGKDVAISFLPTEAKAYSGTITISGGGLSATTVALSGTGVLPIPALDPIAAIDFGKIALGSPASKSVVVEGRNLTGDLTVTVAGVGFTGSTTVTAAEAMAAGGKTISIGFNPTAAGAVSGTLTISGGGLAADVVVNLSGEAKVLPIDMITPYSDATVSGSDWTFDLGTASGYKVLYSDKTFASTQKIEFSKFEDATLTVRARTYGGASSQYISVEVSVDGSDWIEAGRITPTTNSLANYTTTITYPADGYLRFTPKNTTISVGVGFSDVSIKALPKATSTDPSITAANLSFGTVNINTPATKTLSIVGANLSDAIAVTVSGDGFSTTTPSIAAEGGEVSISFTGTAKGDFAGTVTLSNGATTVTYDLTASVIDPADYIVADIAALKAKGTTDKTSVFTLTGDVTFVFRNGRNIYIQDATAGLLIYDNATPVITTLYREGDVISGGIKGKITEFNGQFEFVPTENTATSTQNAGTVTPESIGIVTLVNNYAQYDSKLVNLSGVTFASGSFNTATVTNLDITQDGVTIACRNSFRTLDVTPAVVSNVRGFVSNFNGAVQIFPRSNDDIFITVGCDPNEVSSVKVINLPEGILVEQANEGDLITVFAANGTEVTRQKATSSSETISLGKGFFVVKVGNAVHKVIR